MGSADVSRFVIKSQITIKTVLTVLSYPQGIKINLRASSHAPKLVLISDHGNLPQEAPELINPLFLKGFIV